MSWDRFIYEWVVETRCSPEPGDDILDTQAFEDIEAAERLRRSIEEGGDFATLCLRLDVLPRDEGELAGRFYGYLGLDGSLPHRLESCDGANDGPRLPGDCRRLWAKIISLDA